MIKAVKLEGSSMLPLFKPGEVVLIQSFIPHPSSFILSPGDCVVYSFEGRRLLHRVIAVETGGLLIADDAGAIDPHFVPWKDIEGKVESKKPFTGGIMGRAYSKIKKAAHKLKKVYSR